ncbi:hypothetical protein ATK74_0002 [Propionicimonas paludicola]|uniref:Uncharacterized protein n=1 Tax=Propionicimonas paludicola TaxID=185243 RepID=A0A2A9CMW5_9ACTN|nr:hypothetical protein ATK74_0002 [Propionicimonas paludicola]
MDEVETRLRDGLIAVAEPVRPTVQAEALFAPGERLRRVRRSARWPVGSHWPWSAG